MSIEDVKSLVKHERETEAELHKAREEAAEIVEKAKVEAKRILDEAQNHVYYEKLFENEVKRIDEKKKTLDKECDNVLDNIQKRANMNMEKAISFILKHILEE